MKHAMLIVIPILLFSCTLKDNEKLDPRLMIESTLVENQLQVTEFMDSIMYLNTQLFEKGKETEAYANTAKMLLYMNALPIYYFDSFVDKTLSDESISFDSYVDFYIEYFHREIVLRRPESNQRFDKAIEKHLSELQKKKSKKYLMIKSPNKKGYYEFSPEVRSLFKNIFFSQLGKEFIYAKSPSPGNFLYFARSLNKCYECEEGGLDELKENNYEKDTTACEVIKSLINEGMFSPLTAEQKLSLHTDICINVDDILEDGFRFGNCMLNIMLEQAGKNKLLEQTQHLEDFFKCLNGTSTNVALRNKNLNHNINYYSKGGKKRISDNNPLARDFSDEYKGYLGESKYETNEKGKKFSFKSNDGNLIVEKFTPRNGSGKSITNIQEKGPEGKVIQSIVTKGPKGLAGLSFTIERDANGNFIVKDDLFGESKTFQTQQQVDDYLKSNGVDAEMYDELDNTTTPNPSDLDIPSECLDAWSKVVGEDPIDKSPDRRWTDPSPEDAAKDLGLKEMFDAINQCMISRTGFVVKCDDLIRCPEDVSCPCTGQYYTDPTGLQIPCAPIIDCGPDEYLDVNCNCVDFGQVEGVLPPPVPVRRPLLGDILTEF